MRILSSAEKCRRVARRIFFTTSVAGSFSGTDFCLIFAPCEGYDEPEILPSSTHPICLMSADGGHEASDRCALSFPKIRSGRIRAVRENQTIIRCDVCDHLPTVDVARVRITDAGRR